MIVMKFGGTSVEDAAAINRLIEIVRARLRQRPVVVVSAMAKVTDQLVAMAMSAGTGNLTEALQLAGVVRRRHLDTARQLLGSHSSAQLCKQLDGDFDGLELVLRSIAALGELTPRTTDSVISMGEVLSSQLVAGAFAACGLDGVLVDSRKCIVTDAAHNHALPLFDKTKQRLLAHLNPLLGRNQVPIMGGFIGATESGVPTTIGRGGSDFSASMIGAALGASRIEIWTDVEGMMTTDPNLCTDALPIREIGFDEAAEMATFGAKVLHPATLLPAMQQNIPVYVLNSRNVNSRGTRIRALVSSSRTLFRAIAAKKKISIVYIVADRMLRSHGFLYSVFEVFKRHGVPVDIVATSEVSVSLTVESKQATPELLADLRTLAQTTYEHGKAIVCLVGKNIRGKPGVAAKVFSAVARAGINVRMISQGASEINVSFVIDEHDVPAAVRALHARFFRRASRPRKSVLPQVALPPGSAWASSAEAAAGD